jgi:dUTPase
VAAALVGLGSLANLPVTAAVDSKASEDGWDWFPLILLGLAMRVVKVVEVIGREGWRMIRGRDDIQVERLREQAQLPRKTEDKEGGWCIYPCEGEEKVVNPGEHALVRTGLRIRVPRFTQGRFTTCLDVLRKGGEVGEGIISPDFGEEVKILLKNSSIFQVFQCVKAEVKEVQSQASEIGISPSSISIRVQASSSATRTEKPCLTWEKVWKGTNFSSMVRLILAKKSEFPKWLQKGNHLKGLCRKPCTAGTDLWKCSESSENRIVIREHRKERIKHYVSRDEDVSNRPTMTFAWHQSGIFQIIYSHKPVATELASPWTGFTVCEWGLSPGVPRVALG